MADPTPHEGERAWNDRETRDRESILADITKRRARDDDDESKAKPPVLPRKTPAIEVEDDPDDPTGEGIVTRLRVSRET